MTRATQCTDEDFLLLHQEEEGQYYEEFEEVAVIPEPSSEIDLFDEQDYFVPDAVLDDGIKAALSADEGSVKMESLRLQIDMPATSSPSSELSLGTETGEEAAIYENQLLEGEDEEKKEYHPGDEITEHIDGRTDMGCQTEPARRLSDIVISNIVQTTYSGGRCLVDGCSTLLKKMKIGTAPGGFTGGMKEDLLTMKEHIANVFSSYTRELTLERIRYKLFL